MRTLTELRQDAVDWQARATAIQNRVDTENRDYTAEENTEFEQAMSQLDRVVVDIKRRERLDANDQYLQQPAAGRVTSALQPVNATQGPKANGKSVTNGSGARIEVIDRGLGTHGFQNVGEFAQAVRSACVGGTKDTRLLNSGGPPDPMTEGVNAEGGYAIPPDFRPDIQTLIAGEDSLLPYTDQITTSANAVTVPVDATSPWQGTGGIQAYWGAEAAQKISSKAILAQLMCRLYKLYSLIAISDELLEDAPALGALIRTKAPQKMAFALNQAILNGSGSGQPLGIMKAAATITVPRTTPGTVTMADILKMWNACYGPSRRRAVWITNQDVETLLMSLFFPIPATGTPTAGWPVYLPPGGIASAPYSTLLGRPIIVTEAAQDLGVKGDLILADLSQYLTVTKAGGIKQDISIHLWFDWDVSCFRLVYRIGGCPWWSAPVQSASGSKQRSPFVLLDGTAPAALEAEGGAQGRALSGVTTSADAGAAVGPQTGHTLGAAESGTRKRMSAD